MSIMLRNINYQFEVSDAETTGLMLSVMSQGLGYNSIDTNKIFDQFNISSYEDIFKYKDVVPDIQKQVDKYKNELEIKCEQLQKKWNENKKEFLTKLAESLDIEFEENITYWTYCYLQLLPVNEINIETNTIYLDGSKSVDEIFQTFLVMTAKAFLVDRWRNFNPCGFLFDYDSKNDTWLFAELAIDAIFTNSGLGEYNKNPSYKYFYNLNLDHQNILKMFRELHKKIPLKEFFNTVYMFVHDNSKCLLSFKNYLY